MNHNRTPRAGRSIWILSAITLTFLAPMVLAWWFYTRGTELTEHTVNRGALLQPPRALAALQLTLPNGQPFTAEQAHGKWWLIYVAPRCDTNCQQALYFMRQIRTATGKERLRVARALVTFKPDAAIEPLLQTDYAGTTHLLADQHRFAQVMRGLPSTVLALRQGYLYLVDPLGNIALAYAPKADPKGIFKDLQRLLRVSQIG